MQLFHGDCLELMKNIPDGSIDMILCDLPYGEVNRKSSGLRNLDKSVADNCSIDFEKLISEYKRTLKNGTVYLFCGTKQISLLTELLQNNGFSTRLGLWEKSNPSPMNGDKVWLSGAEFCVIGRQAKATFNRHCEKPIWKYPCGRNKFHPTQKPTEMLEYLIESSTNPGETVLDNCMGSGSTGVACVNTGRNFIGIELDDKYYSVACKRIEAARKRE